MAVAEKADYEVARETLAALLEREKITIECAFVPFSKSRNATANGLGGKPWESLNWKVTIKRNDKVIHVSDYAQGSGHCPASKRAWNLDSGKPDAYAKRQAVAYEIETGKIAKRAWGHTPSMYGSAPIPGPNAVDVLASLGMDSDVINYASYEDWAECFGYDLDSRKGEAVYKECLQTALKLRAALGDALMTEIQELGNRL